MKRAILRVALVCFSMAMLAASRENLDGRMPFASPDPILESTVFAPGEISTGNYEVVPQDREETLVQKFPSGEN